LIIFRALADPADSAPHIWTLVLLACAVAQGVGILLVSTVIAIAEDRFQAPQLGRTLLTSRRLLDSYFGRKLWPLPGSKVLSSPTAALRARSSLTLKGTTRPPQWSRTFEQRSGRLTLASSAEAITVGTIIEIHHTLFAGTRDEGIGGLIREEQNWVGGSSSGPADAEFVPPPAEFVRPALEDLADFFGRTDLAPVLQAAVAHAQFETIHPFLDGNGRVGRALIHVVFRRRGLTPYYVPPVSLVLAGRADRYVRGLTDYRFGNENAWYLTFGEAVEAAADGAREFGKKVAALQQQWRELAGNPRPQSGARKLIDALPVHPVVNLKTVQEVTNVSPEAARQALNRLEEAGVLRTISVGRRNRAFESVGLFALLDSFERDLGPAGRVPVPSQY